MGRLSWHRPYYVTLSLFFRDWIYGSILCRRNLAFIFWPLSNLHRPDSICHLPLVERLSDDLGGRAACYIAPPQNQHQTSPQLPDQVSDLHLSVRTAIALTSPATFLLSHVGEMYLVSLILHCTYSIPLGLHLIASGIPVHK